MRSGVTGRARSGGAGIPGPYPSLAAPRNPGVVALAAEAKKRLARRRLPGPVLAIDHEGDLDLTRGTAATNRENDPLVETGAKGRAADRRNLRRRNAKLGPSHRKKLPGAGKKRSEKTKLPIPKRKLTIAGNGKAGRKARPRRGRLRNPHPKMKKATLRESPILTRCSRNDITAVEKSPLPLLPRLHPRLLPPLLNASVNRTKAAVADAVTRRKRRSRTEGGRRRRK